MSGLQAERGMLRCYGKTERERAMATLKQAHLDHLASRPIGELSGGQLQRVMLCRAIISEPKLLVLDEPTNFVDNRFENELYNLLHHLSHNMAIMMVSHDVGTISSVVNNIVCVNRHVHRHDSNIITRAIWSPWSTVWSHPSASSTPWWLPWRPAGRRNCPGLWMLWNMSGKNIMSTKSGWMENEF